MTKLYTQLANIYHEMYQSVFDYRREFLRADRVFRKYGVKSVLELGSGSGNLAKYFREGGYDYVGMDIARPMLRIAERLNPGARFVHGDMRRFRVARRFDAVLIAGRSFAYLTANDEVLAALRSIRRALKPGGVLLFDNFDARAIFGGDLRKPLRDTIRCGGMTVARTFWRTPNLATGWTWNLDAEYRVRRAGSTKTYRDRSVLRAFTPDELRVFLEMAGFSPVRIARRGAVVVTLALALVGPLPRHIPRM